METTVDYTHGHGQDGDFPGNEWHLEFETLLANYSNASVVDSDPGGVGLPTRRSNCQLFNFIFNGVIIGFLCVMGLAGNTLSMIVLQKDHSNRVAAFLLQCLALADSVVLVISIIALVVFVGWIPYLSPQNPGAIKLRPYLVVYLQPLGYITQSLAIWTTVLLAINRFIAVCCPFLAFRLCTMRKALYQVAAVVVISVVFNVPRFFQYKLVTTLSRDNVTLVTKAVETDMGEQSLFGIVYTNALYTVLVLVLPLILLLGLNTRIIQEMRSLSRRRSSLPNVCNVDTRSEKNITLVMVIIIIIFLICHTPDRIFQILKNFYTAVPCTHVYYLNNFCNLLIIFNSSTNFFIYYIFRKRFRRILCRQLCLWAEGSPGSRTSTALHSQFPSLIRASIQSNRSSKF